MNNEELKAKIIKKQEMLKILDENVITSDVFYDLVKYSDEQKKRLRKEIKELQDQLK